MRDIEEPGDEPGEPEEPGEEQNEEGTAKDQRLMMCIWRNVQ